MALANIQIAILYLATLGAVLLLLGNLFTFLFQDWFIFRPRRLPEDHRYRFTAPFRELNLRSPEGGRLNALWFSKRPGTAGSRVVLYFHGNKGNLERWGGLHPYFTSRGYDLLIFDYRGFGKSSGRRTETNLYKDSRFLYKWLAARYPESGIVLYGRSIGSPLATCTAACFQPSGLILETPFSSMPDLFYTYYPFLPRLFFFKYKFPVGHFLREVKCPTLILQGDRDRVVPLSCAGKLKQVLKPTDQFHLISGGSHNNLGTFRGYRELLTKALKY